MGLDIQQHIFSSIELKRLIVSSEEILKNIESSIKKICCAYRNGKKVILCGNGGSASDAQHLATEFVARYKMDRKALGAISLNTDTSVITAVSNDFNYDYVFGRQLEAIGAEGDILIGITTSGNSQNIINAFKIAKKMNIHTIGLVGMDGGEVKKIADISIKVPSQITPRIQEVHIMIGHIICELVEKELFGDGNE